MLAFEASPINAVTAAKQMSWVTSVCQGTSVVKHTEVAKPPGMCGDVHILHKLQWHAATDICRIC